MDKTHLTFCIFTLSQKRLLQIIQPRKCGAFCLQELLLHCKPGASQAIVAGFNVFVEGQKAIDNEPV